MTLGYRVLNYHKCERKSMVFKDCPLTERKKKNIPTVNDESIIIKLSVFSYDLRVKSKKLKKKKCTMALGCNSFLSSVNDTRGVYTSELIVLYYVAVRF